MGFMLLFFYFALIYFYLAFINLFQLPSLFIFNLIFILNLFQFDLN